MSKNKVDLSLLKRLVVELESSMATADKLKVDLDPHNVEWIVELNKATGVAAGIMTEAGLLMADIQHEIQGTPTTQGQGQTIFDKILGGMKGPGSTN